MRVYQLFCVFGYFLSLCFGAVRVVHGDTITHMCKNIVSDVRMHKGSVIAFVNVVNDCIANIVLNMWSTCD